MSRAISVICTVASAYATQVPLPAKAKTSGMVSTGEVTGAMAATDWASVSQGVRMLWRRPYSISEPRVQRQLWSRAAVVRLQKNWFKQMNLRATRKEGRASV